MKMLAASAFAICLSLAAVSASRAMPLAPLDQAVSTDTIRVAGGCGPGWHRGPYGGCRPLYNCPPGLASRTVRQALFQELTGICEKAGKFAAFLVLRKARC